jgi:hypothetical protein
MRRSYGGVTIQPEFSMKRQGVDYGERVRTMIPQISQMRSLKLAVWGTATTASVGAFGLMWRRLDDAPAGSDTNSAKLVNALPLAMCALAIGISPGTTTGRLLYQLESGVARTKVLGIGLGTVAGAGAVAYAVHFHDTDEHPHTLANVAATGIIGAIAGTIAMRKGVSHFVQAERAARLAEAPAKLEELDGYAARLDRPVSESLEAFKATTQTWIDAARTRISQGTWGGDIQLGTARERIEAIETMVDHGLPDTVRADLQPMRDDINADIQAILDRDIHYRDFFDFAEVGELQSKVDLLKLRMETPPEEGTVNF